MSKKDLSIIFPSIRNKNLPKVYDRINRACSNHNFEVIIASPHNCPNDLNNKENIKWYKTYACPTVATQAAASLCNSEFMCLASDDVLFEDNIFDDGIEAYKSHNLQKYDIISYRLKEGVLDPETLEPLPHLESHNLPPEFFMVRYNPPFHKLSINQDWKLSLTFIVKTDTFFEIGGFECCFEYLNHLVHDFVFRLQYLGGKVYNFPRNGLCCSHFYGRDGDHGPVHDAQTGPDTDKFNEMYSDQFILEKRKKINYNNWKQYDNIWTRRFKI